MTTQTDPIVMEYTEDGPQVLHMIKVPAIEYNKLKSKNRAIKVNLRHAKPYDSYNDGYCPRCESYVAENEYEVFYCVCCGQRLSWTDNESEDE